MTKTVFVFLFAFSFVGVSGCSTTNHHMEPLPKQTKPIYVVIKGVEGPIKRLPLGAIKIENTPVVVAGARHDPSVFGGGLVGVLLSQQTGAIGGSEAVSRFSSAADKTGLDIKFLLEQAIGHALQEKDHDGRFVFSEEKGSLQLRIRPFLILTYVSNTNINAYVALESTLFDGGRRIWSARYFASGQSFRPLKGIGGWTSKRNEPLKSLVKKRVPLLVDVMFENLSNTFEPENSKLITIDGYFPFVSQKLSITGYKLDYDEDDIILLPKVRFGSVVRGVNIVSRSLINRIEMPNPDE